MNRFRAGYNKYVATWRHIPKMSTVTQKDVAEQAGVSRSTVRDVLQGHPRVSAETRNRVLTVAGTMGYRPNSAAQSLISRRTDRVRKCGTIGCLLPPPAVSLRFPYYAHLIEGIRAAAAQTGEEVLLLNDLPSAGWEKVDGVLVFGESRRDVPDRLPISMPVVGLMAEGPGLASVTADDYAGARQAIEHLVALGHRRIGYLTDGLGVSSDTPISQQRLRGYTDGLQAAGIMPQPEWLWNLANAGGEFLERGHDSMRKWLQSSWETLGCTALLVHNDRAAIGAIEVLKSAGVRIPQDLSVVGFDSTDECDLCAPRLTSVRVPLYDIGESAARLLIQMVHEEEPASREIVLPTELQVRASTAPPASPDICVAAEARRKK